MNILFRGDNIVKEKEPSAKQGSPAKNIRHNRADPFSAYIPVLPMVLRMPFHSMP